MWPNPKQNLKKDASHLKTAWQSKKQKKKIEKRERKTKNEKKPNKFFFFYFYFFIYKNLYFAGNYVIVLLCITIFFGVAGYWNCSNKIPKPIKICIGLVDTLLRPKILVSKLGILT